MITFEEDIKTYHQSRAIGSGKLRYFISNPHEYKAMFVTCDHPKLSDAKEEKRHLIMGQAFEDKVSLTPEEFSKKYVTIPEDAPSRPTSAQINAKNPAPKSIDQINWWRQWDNDTVGMITLSCNEMETLERMHENFVNNAEAFDLWDSCKYQMTVRNDKIKGAEIQCRFDGIIQSVHHGIDLKTTGNSLESFQKSIVDFRYDIQEAWYKATYEIETGYFMPCFDFIVSETVYPYRTQVITLPEIVKENASFVTALKMKELLKCYETGNFPATESKVELEFKYWQLKELGIQL